jgi:hypothetical protein
MLQCFDAFLAIHGEKLHDQEIEHTYADELMCGLLEALGYKEGVDIFRKAEKWYA